MPKLLQRVNYAKRFTKSNYAKTFTKNSSCSSQKREKYSDDAVMSDILNEHFVSVMNCNTSKLPAFDYQCPNGILSSIDFTELDIEKLLIKVKPFKAIGPDEIHSHVLHEVPTFAKPLCILFKQSLVQHDRLLYKLSKYGTHGSLLKRLGGFLKLRRQRVVLNGSPST